VSIMTPDVITSSGGLNHWHNGYYLTSDPHNPIQIDAAPLNEVRGIVLITSRQTAVILAANVLALTFAPKVCFALASFVQTSARRNLNKVYYVKHANQVVPCCLADFFFVNISVLLTQ
jgi:hypothetical protein